MSDNINNTAQEEVIQAQKPRDPLALSMLEFVEMFIAIVLVVLLMFTFVARLCTVNGSSMNQTLQNGQTLVTTNIFYTPKQGDIVVFHQTGSSKDALNEPLVKRVIATEGQHIKIDFSVKDKMVIWVDGVEYSDTNAYFDAKRSTIYPQYNFDSDSKIFEATVPDGHIFVLGDNRNNSKDSRSLSIGFVDQRRIIGRCITK